MKYIFSFFYLLIAFSVKAELIAIYHADEGPTAELMKSILIEDIQIPSNLISVIKHASPCMTRPHRIQFCVLEEGSFKTVQLDEAFISESLKVFTEKAE